MLIAIVLVAHFHKLSFSLTLQTEMALTQQAVRVFPSDDQLQLQLLQALRLRYCLAAIACS
jgi:hypothetical protein